MILRYTRVWAPQIGETETELRITVEVAELDYGQSEREFEIELN